ncbi:MAG TPA: MFS transporter [Pseudonocardia sp.]|nr:MFS transporter [Pseudonocardia sp.]
MSDPAAARRFRAVLGAAGVLGGLAQSLAGAAGGLLVPAAGWSDALAGLPMTAQVVGAAVAGIGLSRLTAGRGRRTALAVGAAVAAVGCAGVVVAAGLPDLFLVLAGMLLVGGGMTAVALGRYAAADLVAEQDRPAAMAGVLVAVTVGAVTGPNLLGPAAGLGAVVGMAPLPTAYLIAAAGFGCAAVVLAVGLRGLPGPTTTGSAPAATTGTGAAAGARPGRRIVAGPARAGLGTLGLANLVMVGVMTMTPLHLHHAGSGLWVIGGVVGAHIAAMYAPAPLSAWLTARISARRAAAVAAAVLAGACGLAAADLAPVLLVVAMVVLGAGWNLALVSGSTLLTAGVPVAERPRREGAGEVAMGVAAATGGALSGPVLAVGGYPLLAATGAVLALLIVPAARRAPTAVPAPTGPGR